jgi:quinohemoprotein ethanol dehydrogenase
MDGYKEAQKQIAIASIDKVGGVKASLQNQSPPLGSNHDARVLMSRLRHFSAAISALLHGPIFAMVSNISSARYLGILAASLAFFVTPQILKSADIHDGPSIADSWPEYGRSPYRNHFSPLAGINITNVSRLGLGWWQDIVGTRMPASEPIEINGKLYLSTGYTVISAIDAISGRMLWSYDPGVPAIAGKKLRVGMGVRGISSWGNQIFAGTQDGRLLSINADNGTLVWSVQTTEGEEIQYITGSPLVFDGKVMIGHGGSEHGAVRGYVTTYDATTGNKLWRFYTVPGNPAAGFESEAMRLAAKTWSGRWWKYGGGGTVWNAMAYDSELNRVYLGTSNGSPWNRRIRSPEGGDNLFLTSIVALDANTGAYIWHYQTSPGDTWDFDATADIEIAHLMFHGRDCRVLMQASKNGFFYVVDRYTGRLLTAEKFSKATWAKKIDEITGRPVESPNARYDVGTVRIWPGHVGAHGTEAMSYNPMRTLAYIPTRELSAEYSDQGIDLKNWAFDPSADLNLGVKTSLVLPENSASTLGVSSLVAWNPVKQRAIWRVPLPGIANGGTIATAGDLVLQGRCDGIFVAYDAKSGRPVWSFDAQGTIAAAPITYQIGKIQYVSILAGVGGGRLPPQRLLTFALDSHAKLPLRQNREILPIKDPDFVSDPRRELVGERKFHRCTGCHGQNAVSSGVAPDLRESLAIVQPAEFFHIVNGGILRAQGMPPFTELTKSDVEDMRQYLRARAMALNESRSLDKQ